MLILGNIYFIPMFGKLTETKPVYWRISTPLTTTTNGQSLQSTLQGPLKFSFKALQEKTEQRRQAKTTGIKKKKNPFCLNVEGKREGTTQNKLSFLIMYPNSNTVLLLLALDNYWNYELFVYVANQSSTQDRNTITCPQDVSNSILTSTFKKLNQSHSCNIYSVLQTSIG